MGWSVFFLRFGLAFALVWGAASSLLAQEKPYFVTYSTDLEEPGNLEVAFKGMGAGPKNDNGFLSQTMELEYGATAWWTTEFYLQGQSTAGDSTVFTGFRWENRFRPLARQHLVTPVIYIEYEQVSDADKSVLEVTGHDSIEDYASRNAETRSQVNHTLEGKLILSSNFRGWNFSENSIAEKNLSPSNPWEFGYSVGATRALGLEGSAWRCWLCRQNFDLGAEVYGGLGNTARLGLSGTSHYAGPVFGFRAPNGVSYSFSPQLGLNDNSIAVLWRFKVSYEVQQVRDWFRGRGSR